MFPDMISGYDAQNNAILKAKGNVDALTESYKKNVETAYASTLTKSSESFSDYKTAIEDAESTKKTVETLLNAEKITGYATSKGGFQFNIDDDYYADDIKKILDSDTYSDLVTEVESIPSNHWGRNKRDFKFSDLSTILQQKIKAALTTANATIKTETAKVKPILEAFVYGNGGKDSGFNSLDEEGKQAVRNMISNLDDSFYTQFKTESDMVSYFYTNFIEPLKDGLDSPELAIKINTLFSLNQNDYDSYQDYIDAVNNIINQIRGYKDSEGNPLYSEEQVNGLKNILGVGKTNKSEQLSGADLIDTVKGRYSSIDGADEFIKTLNEKELRCLYELKPDEVKSLDNLKQAVNHLNKETSNNETAISTPLTFNQAWNTIDTTGTNEQKSDKEKLLELAKAGKLTEEALKNTSLASVFEEAGVSIEEATKKINKMKSSADQLASMKTGISSISNILGEKKENRSSKKTRTKGIGADTLAGMPEDVKAQTKEYEHFVEVLGDGTSDMDKCQDAANKLATAYVNSNNFLSNLTDETEDYYISVLKEMGVENAAEIVKQSLAQKAGLLAAEKEFLETKGKNLEDATWDEIEAFMNEKQYSDEAANALYQFALQKELANGTTLNADSDIDAIIRLVENLGGATSALRQYNSIKNGDYYVPSDAQNGIAKAAQEEINDAFNKGKKKTTVKTEIKPTSPKDSSPTSKDKNKDNSKSAKQSFDWLERRISVLNDGLDLLKAKIENVFTVKKKNSIIDDEIKNTNKLISTYKKQASVYKKQANKSAKSTKTESGEKKSKLSKKLKKQIQNGQIKDSRQKLIKTYGEETANAIQEYQGYWDKYQEARTNIQSGRTSRRELRIQQKQYWADHYDSLSSKYDAQIENAFTAKDKNKLEDKKIKSTRKSYNKQIKIAELEKDSAKVATLRAEKEKAIRDIKIKKHQNLADEYQNTLDRYSAEKELATKASDKNDFIDKEKSTLDEIYREKIEIARLEGNETEMMQLQAELAKEQRDLDIEKHQNLADKYQSELDAHSAEKANLKTAKEKNTAVDEEIALTKQLYDEKIAMAQIEGDINEELKLRAEYEKDLVAKEKEKFDNIVHYYENLLKLPSNSYNDTSNAINELEARGLIVGSAIYSSQIAINKEKQKLQEEELALLNDQLNYIDEGTDEWYEAQDAIQSCKDEIAGLTKNTLELQKTIRNINWQIFDKISSRISLISSEYDLLIKYMSNKKLVDDDTGNFTKEGTATLGAYLTQLELSKKKTSEFEADLGDMWDNLQSGEEGYTDQAAWDEYYEKCGEYVTLKSEEFDIEQNLIDLMKEKYNKELDYLQDIINKRKELLKAEKDEYEYRRTIEEKTKNISTIAKQLNALSGDDSEAAKTKIQQLKVSLDEAKQDLQDTEYDKWISDQEEMLDSLYNEYHDFIDDKLNDANALLQEAVNYIKGDGIGTSIAKTFGDYMTEHGYIPTQDTTDINNSIKDGNSVEDSINKTIEPVIEKQKKLVKDQNDAAKVIKLISEIGEVDLDGEGYRRLAAAQNAYDSLSDEAKEIVNSTAENGYNTLKEKGLQWGSIYQSVMHSSDADGKKPKTENKPQEDEKNSAKQQKEKAKTDLKNSINDALRRDPWTLQKRRFTDTLDKNGTSTLGQIQKRFYDSDIKGNGETPYLSKEFIENLLMSGLRTTPLNSSSRAKLISNKDDLLKYMDDIGFAEGGIAATLQKVPVANGDDGWITVKRGESILTQEQTRNFATLARHLDDINMAIDLKRNLAEIRSSILPEQGIHSTSIGDISMNIELPNVTNYEEFRRQMQSDPKIESMFKSMIWDKGSLSKYRTNV